MPKNKWTIDQVNHFYEAKEDRMNDPVFGIEVDKIKAGLSSEHCDYKWCKIDEALQLFTWTQQRNGLRAFYQMINSKSEKLNLQNLNFFK